MGQNDRFYTNPLLIFVINDDSPIGGIELYTENDAVVGAHDPEDKDSPRDLLNTRAYALAIFLWNIPIFSKLQHLGKVYKISETKHYSSWGMCQGEGEQYDRAALLLTASTLVGQEHYIAAPRN